MQSFLGFSSYYRKHIKRFSHIASSFYKLFPKDLVFKITKERRDAYERIKHKLTNASVLLLPDFALPFKLYIDAAFSQGLGAALHQRQIVDDEPRGGVICYIPRHLKDPEARWPLENFKRNPAYDPEADSKIAIHLMERDRCRNFRSSEWAPGSCVPDNNQSEPEETNTPILGISSSERHNEFFNSVIKIYTKHKQFSIHLQLLQQINRRPELQSQLEEPWLRDYKGNKFFLTDWLLYQREEHTSSLTGINRDHISLTLKECHDFPKMGHMSECMTKERVASTY
ncbi:hypothetical protein O181_039230 [Austropuccinia psidii MF-1]|uniref:Reverse transcriptase/retrotransposon-derived protein RNase H-like domain-containing protein n=1 Tax=Austropuccinia psidii MF-1 TaxID=1389203 RepID=A0A9Q3DB75_9BASI|nr:hypothetical protein [Austropuccinia psidii MF-1]